MEKNLPGPTSIAPCASMHISDSHVGLRAEPEKLHCPICLGHQHHLEMQSTQTVYPTFQQKMQNG